jgi:hypothetical protein
MNFQDLHERLRLELVRRIEQGALTGTRLAQQTGFRQAHISNFLNRKRALSLEGLDRVLSAQELAIEQILPLAMDASADHLPPGHSVFEGPLPQDTSEMIPVVSLSAATEDGLIEPTSVIEMAHASASRLAENRVRVSRRQTGWQRFVAVRVGVQEAAAMHPVLVAGTIAVIDRHYNSIAPYHAEHPSLLAVRYGPGLLLRFAELDNGRLVLRPIAIEHPLHFLTMGPNDRASEYIVGRVCLLLHEL